MHTRTFPKKNSFRYKIYYLFLNLRERAHLNIPYNKMGLLSFFDKDHGDRHGKDIEQWCREILEQKGLNEQIKDIILVSMPRVLGYVFNPVSFWLCLDEKGQMRAVVCEVNNTFGESHAYVCFNETFEPIRNTHVLVGEKVFHVSPFLERNGTYRFRFDYRDEKFGAWVDYLGNDEKTGLFTYVKGDLHPLTKRNIQKAFWKYPLITLKAIVLIHWQAIKIFLKGIKYISKPSQLPHRVSTASKKLKK